MANVPISNMTVTWTDSGTTYNAVKMNVTDTASNAASLLMDLQVGTVSKFKVPKNGNPVFVVPTSGYLEVNGNGDGFRAANGSAISAYGPYGVRMGASNTLSWGSSADGPATADTTLARDAADTLAQRRTTNAQTFRVYNTYTDASNYERGVFDWSSTANILTIGSQKLGTGAVRNVSIVATGSTIQISPGSTNTWKFDGTSGSFLANSDNAWDIGASGANRPRSIYAGTSLVLGTASFVANGPFPYLATTTGNVTQFNSVGGFIIAGNGSFGFTANATSALTTADTIFTRKGAANLQFGAADAAAPVAQTLSVQSVVAGTTNIAGTDLTITGSQGTGTGAGGKITFSAANAGTSGSTQNPLVDRMRISGIDANTALFELNSNGGYANFTATGNSLFIATGTGSSNNHDVSLPGLISYRLGQGYGVGIGTGASVPVLQGGVQEDSDALAQRRATNPQTFRVYNTYTNSTNYERGFLKWNTNVLQIGTEKGSGGGTARDLAFQTDGTTRLTISASGVTTAAAIDVISQGGLTFASTYELRCTSRLRVSSPADGNLLVTNWATGDFGRLQFGGTTSSFPSLKRSATALQCRLADDTAFAPLEASTIGTSTAYTVATLPAAGTAGRRAYVTDATAPTFLGALTGGGAVKCPVFDDGTAWVAG